MVGIFLNIYMPQISNATWLQIFAEIDSITSLRAHLARLQPIFVANHFGLHPLNDQPHINIFSYYPKYIIIFLKPNKCYMGIFILS